eukprot:GHVT01045230.1.p1 GENE.GHVT01045230.1~~GHVT01045230.1.p1  ORF type:complete len:725 (+),score=60.93 GHVT01045230.1:108-2282(+)
MASVGFRPPHQGWPVAIHGVWGCTLFRKSFGLCLLSVVRIFLIFSLVFGCVVRCDETNGGFSTVPRSGGDPTTLASLSMGLGLADEGTNLSLGQQTEISAVDTNHEQDLVTTNIMEVDLNLSSAKTAVPIPDSADVMTSLLDFPADFQSSNHASLSTSQVEAPQKQLDSSNVSAAEQSTSQLTEGRSEAFVQFIGSKSLRTTRFKTKRTKTATARKAKRKRSPVPILVSLAGIVALVGVISLFTYGVSSSKKHGDDVNSDMASEPREDRTKKRKSRSKNRPTKSRMSDSDVQPAASSEINSIPTITSLSSVSSSRSSAALADQTPNGVIAKAATDVVIVKNSLSPPRQMKPELQNGVVAPLSSQIDLARSGPRFTPLDTHNDTTATFLGGTPSPILDETESSDNDITPFPIPDNSPTTSYTDVEASSSSVARTSDDHDSAVSPLSSVVASISVASPSRENQPLAPTLILSQIKSTIEKTPDSVADQSGTSGISSNIDLQTNSNTTSITSQPDKNVNSAVNGHLSKTASTKSKQSLNVLAVENSKQSPDASFADRNSKEPSDETAEGLVQDDVKGENVTTETASTATHDQANTSSKTASKEMPTTDHQDPGPSDSNGVKIEKKLSSAEAPDAKDEKKTPASKEDAIQAVAPVVEEQKMKPNYTQLFKTVSGAEQNNMFQFENPIETQLQLKGNGHVSSLVGMGIIISLHDLANEYSSHLYMGITG